MEPDRYLIATAQISLALAGFTGIVATYRNKSVHEWGKVEQFWLRLLLLNAILPFALSLSAIFVIATDLAAPVARWSWLSGLATIFLVPYSVMIVRRLIELSPGELRAAGGGIVSSYGLFFVLIAVCLVQMWNTAFGWAFGPFFAAIVALILGAVFQFGRLVIARGGPEPKHVTEDPPEEA